MITSRAGKDDICVSIVVLGNDGAKVLDEVGSWFRVIVAAEAEHGNLLVISCKVSLSSALLGDLVGANDDKFSAVLA